jgi:uncharacterized membrane protein
MKNLIYAYILFILFDSPWLFITKPYWNQIAQRNITLSMYALLAYIALAVSIVYIAEPLSKYYKSNVIAGILTGFVIYFCFDMTNLAIFGSEKYPLSLAIGDTLWGMLVTTLVLIVYKKLSV